MVDLFLLYANVNEKYENDLEKILISVFFHNNYKDGVEMKKKKRAISKHLKAKRGLSKLNVNALYIIFPPFIPPA